MEVRFAVRNASLNASRGRKVFLGPGTKHFARDACRRGCRRSLATIPPLRDSSAVRILEVGARDGLQNIKQTVPTATKVELIRRLAATGLTNIEATSFVSPKWIPQLADGAEVMKQILPLAQQSGITFPVLVPNAKGLERAIQSNAAEVVVFASASEGFSRKNTNCSIDEALRMSRKVAEHALQQGIAVRGVVSCIFACPYDGPTVPAAVLKVVRELLDMGCYEVGLGDTLGVGTPAQVQNLLRVLLMEVPPSKLAGHFHDTYGQAVANVVKSYDMGLRAFDSSVAGLGGCPYAKGAKGNLATEDITYTLDKMGVHTGIDLDKLVSVGEWISQQLAQPNGSRAGSALFAKQQSAAASVPVKNANPEVPPRTWNQVEDTGEFTVSRAGPAVKITLTRPRNGNALTNSMISGLTRLFKSLASDESIFHIILAAEGKFFCTGMDLSATGDTSTSDTSDTKSNDFFKLVEFFAAVDNAPQTTIAMVDGPCYGGGNGLAFVCDVRLVSSRSSFTLSEIKLGLSPAIISPFIIREWGIPFAREAILTGRTVPPSQLQQLGAVHGIATDTDALDRMVEDYLDKLANCAPRSATACKQLTRLAWTDPDGQGQADIIESTFFNMLAPGSEGRYGIEQFVKKIKKVDWAKFWAAKSAKL